MFNIIERYINKLSKEDIKNFAISKNIYLSDNEINFTYDFIKKNYQDALRNPKLFDIDRYKNNYTEENFSKITKVFHEYLNKYQNYL